MRPLLYGRQRFEPEREQLPPEKRLMAACLYRKGESDARIAYFCGCSKQAVRDWRKRTGRKSNQKKN